MLYLSFVPPEEKSKKNESWKIEVYTRPEITEFHFLINLVVQQSQKRGAGPIAGYKQCVIYSLPSKGEAWILSGYGDPNFQTCVCVDFFGIFSTGVAVFILIKKNWISTEKTDRSLILAIEHHRDTSYETKVLWVLASTFLLRGIFYVSIDPEQSSSFTHLATFSKFEK